MKRLLIAVLVFALLPLVAGASTVHPLLNPERLAWGGATHEVILTHADLTETSTNTAQTLTAVLPVAAKQSCELVAMRLVTPFTYSSTNGFTSVAVEVGDGSDTDLYLTSTELNSYGSEIYLKGGRTTWSTTTANGDVLTNFTATLGNVGTAVTMLYQDLTNLTAFGASTTGTVRFVTNVSLTVSAAMTNIVGITGSVMGSQTLSYGLKVYTADDFVDFKFTPGPAFWALNDIDAGEVRYYFKIYDAR